MSEIIVPLSAEEPNYALHVMHMLCVALEKAVTSKDYQVEKAIREDLNALKQLLAAFDAERERAEAAEKEIEHQHTYYALLLETCAMMKARAEAAENRDDLWEAATRPIPVGEFVPDLVVHADELDGSSFLVSSDVLAFVEGGWRVAWRYESGWHDENGPIEAPSHWRPLPAAIEGKINAEN